MIVPEEKIAKLREYVEDREAVLARIVAHYGVSRGAAKYAPLRVLNGGQLATWVNDPKVGCTRGKEEPQSDLRDLEMAAAAVRDAFFAMDKYKDHVTTLRAELRASTQARVRQAEERLAAASPIEAERVRKELDNARRKASAMAIERSLFSLCIMDLEDTVLSAIDECFQSNGWTVSSLQYDGLHVEHRASDTLVDGKWVQFEAAMRAAEEAVERQLGYTIQLVEKPLYNMHEEAVEEVNDDALEEETMDEE
jgi:hypothetical protein